MLRKAKKSNTQDNEFKEISLKIMTEKFLGDSIEPQTAERKNENISEYDDDAENIPPDDSDYEKEDSDTPKKESNNKTAESKKIWEHFYYDAIKYNSDSDSDLEDKSTYKYNTYKQYSISSNILSILKKFNLDPEILMAKDHPILGRRKKPICDFIDDQKDSILPLIKFYHETPSLEVKDLFNYNKNVIQYLSLYDKEFKFHRWLIKNKLHIPSQLVSQASDFDLTLKNKIYFLCYNIPYLENKIFLYPEHERQRTIDRSIEGDFEASKEFFENTMKQVNKYTQGPHSLFWLCAEKLAEKNISIEKLNKLPKDVRFVASMAINLKN